MGGGLSFGGERIKIRCRESTGGNCSRWGRMSKFVTGGGDSLYPASRENPSDLALFCRGTHRS